MLAMANPVERISTPQMINPISTGSMLVLSWVLFLKGKITQVLTECFQTGYPS